MKRAFWVALGLGAGAAVGISATRWARKQANRVAPANLAREAQGGLMELSNLFSESLQEGRRAMKQAEAEARTRATVSPRDPPSDPQLPPD